MIEMLALPPEPGEQIPAAPSAPADATGSTAGGFFTALLTLLQAQPGAPTTPEALPAKAAWEGDAAPSDGATPLPVLKQAPAAAANSPLVLSQAGANSGQIAPDLQVPPETDGAIPSDQSGPVGRAIPAPVQARQLPQPPRPDEPSSDRKQGAFAALGSMVRRHASLVDSAPAIEFRPEQGSVPQGEPLGSLKRSAEMGRNVETTPISGGPVSRPAPAAFFEQFGSLASQLTGIVRRKPELSGPAGRPEAVDNEARPELRSESPVRVPRANSAAHAERQTSLEALRAPVAHVVRPTKLGPEAVESSTAGDTAPDLEAAEGTSASRGGDHAAEATDRSIPARADEAPPVIARPSNSGPPTASYVRPEDALVSLASRSTVRPPVVSETLPSPVESRAPSDLAGLPNETVRGVRLLLANGEHSLRIRLVPQSLGEVHLEVSTVQGEVAVKLASGNASVRDALQNSLVHLRETLIQDGHRVTAVTVSPELPSQFGWGHGERHAPPPARYHTPESGFPPRQDTGDQSRPDPRHAKAWHGGRLNLLV